MSDWLIYSFGGSFFFALVDVINDINLSVHESENKDTDHDGHAKKDKMKIKESDITLFGQQKEINASQDVFIASCFSVVEIFLFFFIKIELSVFEDDFSEQDVQALNYTDTTYLTDPIIQV